MSLRSPKEDGLRESRTIQQLHQEVSAQFGYCKPSKPIKAAKEALERDLALESSLRAIGVTLQHLGFILHKTQDCEHLDKKDDIVKALGFTAGDQYVYQKDTTRELEGAKSALADLYRLGLTLLDLHSFFL